MQGEYELFWAALIQPQTEAYTKPSSLSLYSLFVVFSSFQTISSLTSLWANGNLPRSPLTGLEETQAPTGLGYCCRFTQKSPLTGTSLLHEVLRGVGDSFLRLQPHQSHRKHLIIFTFCPCGLVTLVTTWLSNSKTTDGRLNCGSGFRKCCAPVTRLAVRSLLLPQSRGSLQNWPQYQYHFSWWLLAGVRKSSPCPAL